MITKEQAEQAFHKRYDHPNATVKPEIRNLEMEEMDSQQIDMDVSDDLGQFDIEDRCWRCTFEIRYREEWRKDTCYVVEPKPGPYVID